MSTPRSIDERFTEFHATHPEVYAHLVRLARQAKAKGRGRVGIKMLYEVIRWHIYLETGAKPRLSNDYHSRYSREIMAREPDLAGLFELRGLSEAPPPELEEDPTDIEQEFYDLMNQV